MKNIFSYSAGTPIAAGTAGPGTHRLTTPLSIQQNHNNHYAPRTYNPSTIMAAAGGTRITPPLKRPRLMVPSMKHQRAQSPKKIVLPGIDDLRTYSK